MEGPAPLPPHPPKARAPEGQPRPSLLGLSPGTLGGWVTHVTCALPAYFELIKHCPNLGALCLLLALPRISEPTGFCNSLCSQVFSQNCLPCPSSPIKHSPPPLPPALSIPPHAVLTTTRHYIVYQCTDCLFPSLESEFYGGKNCVIFIIVSLESRPVPGTP